MRIGKAQYSAKAGDYFSLIPGDQSRAHQLRNTSSDTLRYLVLGINERVDIVG